MSLTSLSRRAILAGAAAAVPAITVPELASPKASPAPSPARDEPTAIGRLWIEAKTATREYKKTRRQCEKLEKILEREMPDPDPSIVFSNPDNAADGLAYWVPDREPPYFKHYIFSGWLEGKVEAAHKPKMCKFREDKDTNGRDTLTIELRPDGDEPFPVTEEQMGLRERLKKRLELSRQYEEQKDRMSDRIGLTAAEERVDRACSRQARLFNKILRLPATTRSDFKIKLAIYERWGEDIATAELILRDVKRLVKAPQDFPQSVMA